MFLTIAGFIGMCAAFYVGAWARLRCKSLWTKAVMLLVGWISGYLVAMVVGFVGLMVIANFSGAIDISTGSVDVEAAHKLGAALGAKKIEFLTATMVASIAGLVSSLSERIGMAKSPKQQGQR